MALYKCCSIAAAVDVVLLLAVVLLVPAEKCIDFHFKGLNMIDGQD